MRVINTFALFFLFGCGDEVKPAPEPSDEGDILVDNDGDGFFSDEDCDDNDSATYPTASEICDGYDNNCDGQADEDVTSTFYVDSDGDGFGNENISTQACSAPNGYTINATDCDDTTADSYPGAEEICDNKDNDCNAEIDDGIGQMFYVDADGDGFGDENNQSEACDLRLGLSAVSGDCDDTNILISPSAVEICDEIDNNCNNEIDEGVSDTFYIDEDEDGFGNPDITMEGCSLPEGYVDNSNDCNDTDTLINPSANEYCDTVDNNCDGVIDENYSVDATLFYADVDGDTFGNEENTILACSVPEGYVTNTDDCNDTNDLVSPNATEFCNGVDDNCDGEIDEIGVAIDNIYYLDDDNDGYGQTNNTVTACGVPEGYSEESGDCDDDNNAVYPDAPELCNDEDDDCDSDIDEEITQTFYLDEDGDGFGNPDITTDSCLILEGYVLVGDDCDDTTELRSPDNDEICDEIDNDCDSDIDEESINALTYYLDSDSDGYGDSDSVQTSCDVPENYVENDLDCDDTTDTRSPGNAEICDGIDNDCNDVVDEQTGENLTVYYLDDDEDGYGDLNNTLPACAQPEGYVLNADDCDDDDDDISPDADEVCGDATDNNCDSLIDDETSIDAVLYYEDGDGDGFGDNDSSSLLCSMEAGFVTDNTDCDDNDDDIYPNAPEICNEESDDCDEEIDEEITQMFYLDQDVDGFGNPEIAVESCTILEGYVLNDTDCDDDDNSSNPGASEIFYNDIDEDCNPENDFDLDGDGVDSYLFGGGFDCDDSNANVTTCGFDQSTALRSCNEILTASVDELSDGLYWIDPDNDGDKSDAWQAYCDMSRDDGGWTLVMQNNFDIFHGVNMTYSQSLFDITIRGGTLSDNLADFDLLVGLSEWGDIGTESRIEVSNVAGVPVQQGFYTLTLDENDGYRLSMSDQVLVGTDVEPGIYSYHAAGNYRFTASDADQDIHGGNCSTFYNSPWWYGACWSGNLWGSTISHSAHAYWLGSSQGTESYDWGAIWLR